MITNCKQCKKGFEQIKRRKFFCCQKCSVVHHNKSKKQRDILKSLNGVNSPSWLGEKAGYFAKHMWIRQNYGSANRCEICKTNKKIRFEWANLSGDYIRDVKDYIPLCVFCHRSFDLGKKVTQYSLDGKFIKSYPSSAEAARNIGVSKTSILNVVSGKKKTCRGFLWRLDKLSV